MQHVHLKPPSNGTAEAGRDRWSLCSPTPCPQQGHPETSPTLLIGPPTMETRQLSGPVPVLHYCEIVFLIFKWNFPCFSLSPLPHLVMGHHGEKIAFVLPAAPIGCLHAWIRSDPPSLPFSRPSSPSSRRLASQERCSSPPTRLVDEPGPPPHLQTPHPSQSRAPGTDSSAPRPLDQRHTITR